MSAPETIKKLTERFGAALGSPTEFRGEWSVQVRDAEQIVEVCRFAKEELGFEFLVDITSIDEYGNDPRFTIVYHLYSYTKREYVRLRTAVSEEKSEVPSVIGVWATADWHEREAYDMMGIRFRGHPDLRRILMWEGYPYYPLLKDFPLAGKPSDVREMAFTETAPWLGGPFVTVAGGADAISREPRVRIPDQEGLALNNRVERRKDIADAHGKGEGPGPMEKR